MSESAKKKKPKPGKVIRVSPPVWDLLLSRKKPKETIDALVRRLLGVRPRKGESKEMREFFICPSSGIIIADCKDISEARGRVILLKKKLVEDPILVKEVV